MRAGLSAVADPQFVSVLGIVGAEEYRVPGRGESRGIAAKTAWVNVFDKDGAGRGAIAFPQFAAVNAIVRREKERVADDGQVLRRRAAEQSWVDVLDEGRAGR